jgi:TolB protein
MTVFLSSIRRPILNQNKRSTYLGIFLILLILGACGGPAVKLETLNEEQVANDPELAALQQSIADNPESPTGYINMANHLEATGYDRDAIAVLEQGKLKVPTNMELRYEAGRLYAKNGDLVKGYQYFRQVMSSAVAMSYVDKIGPYFLDVYAFTPLVATAADEAYAWIDSADQAVYYQSNVNGNWDVFRVAISGGLGEQLTFSEANEENPTVLRDGTGIILVSDRDDKRPVPYEYRLRDIYLYRYSDSSYTNLTENFSGDFLPRLAPKTNELVFVSERDDLREDANILDKYSHIFVMETSGIFQVAMTKGDFYDSNPVYSPDGRWIYFNSNRDGDAQNIFKVNTETKDIERILPNGNWNNFSPAISSDGDNLVYVSDRDGNFELYKYSFTTRLEERITSSESEDLSPIFFNKSNKLIFQSNRNGNYDLYILDLAAKNVEPSPLEILSRIDNKLIMMGAPLTPAKTEE